MQNDEKTLARVDSQPLSATAELPQRPTETVRATAPEKAASLLASRFCVSIEIFDNLTREMIFEDGFNCERPAAAIRALELALARMRETV